MLHTAQTLQSLSRQTVLPPNTIRTQLMQHARNGLRIRKHAGNLTHGAIRIDRLKLAGIHISIPIGHVDDKVIILHTGVRELGEETARVQIMIILIDLANRITNLEVGLEIVHPVTFRAVDRHTTVRAFEMRVRRRLAPFVGDGGFASFRIVRGGRSSSLLVAWVWAEGILLDEGGALADDRRGRVREGVEEVVGFQEGTRVDGRGGGALGEGL